MIMAPETGSFYQFDRGVWRLQLPFFPDEVQLLALVGGFPTADSGMHRLAVRREHIRRLNEGLPDEIQASAAWIILIQHGRAHGFHELKGLRDRLGPCRP